MAFRINFTVKNRLGLGFGVVLVVMFVVSINTFVKLKQIENTQDRLLELRLPTVSAGARLENGINQSLAGLRGYMILGEDPKKAELMREARLIGWKNIIQIL